MDPKTLDLLTRSMTGDKAAATEESEDGLSPGPSSPSVYFWLTPGSTSLLFLTGMVLPSGAHILDNADPFDGQVSTGKRRRFLG